MPLSAPIAASQPFEERSLFGIPFAQLDLEQVIQLLATVPPAGAGVRAVVTANVDHIVRLSEDAKLRKAYQNAWLRTLDGKPLYAYAQLLSLGTPHVAGADIIPELLKRLSPNQHRLFFVVAEDALGDKLLEWARTQGFSDEQIGIATPPMGFEANLPYQEQLAAQIKAHGATHLFMGIGCPRSEVWIDNYATELGDLYALSVGAALAFHVGTMTRAPVFVRKIGMEWLWRVKEEPRRLAKRYFVRSWSFLGIFLKDFFSRVIGRGGYDLGIHAPKGAAQISMTNGHND